MRVCRCLIDLFNVADTKNRFGAFFKNLFKCVHIAEVLKDREGKTKTEPDKAKVFLLQALLRGERYPRTQAAYDALAKAGKPWHELIASPLARIAEDPLFRVADEWTAPGFQESLAGAKMPLPRCTSVESMLCAHGNRRVTWHAIFECGEITSRQVRYLQYRRGYGVLCVVRVARCYALSTDNKILI